MQQRLFPIIGVFLAFSLFFLAACAQIPDKPDYRFPQTTTDDSVQQLKTRGELTAFLQQHQKTSGYGGSRGVLESAGSRPTALAKASEDAGARSADGSSRYSQTNVQVEGVDEADFVKNDGKYIYALTQNNLVIVDAYPLTTAKITATLSFAGTPRQLFVNKDRLLVFTDIQQEYPVYKEILPSAGIAERSIYPPIRYEPPKTGVYIYDTKNKQGPKLVANYTIEGYYYQSRMIGDYVYAVAQHPSYSYGGDPVPLPAIESNKGVVAESPVYYFDNYEPSLNFNSIASFNLFNPDDVQLRSYLLGYANTLYVSQNAIYLAYQKQLSYRYYQQQALDLWKQAVLPVVSRDVQKTMQKILDSDMEISSKQQRLTEALENYYNSLPGSGSERVRKQLEEQMVAWSQQQQEEQMKTIIHKLNLKKGDVQYVTKGEVKGTLLNQFSLDEYDSHLRVATTVDLYGRKDHVQYNNVYVLDDDLDVVGKLENLAPNERIYSARFMGKKGYLVTFKKVDPLFVIDLSIPTKPTVLGKLKIPGYSDYLHPYDENHIIGIGKDTAEAEDDLKQQRQLDFAWYQGIKMALFDVSDVQNPKELHKALIGDRGTESDALHEHKAFLFDKEKQLLVLPITLAEIKGEKRDPTQYGSYTFQGAYVYQLTLNKGFVLKGRITHYDDPSVFEKSGYYFQGDAGIRRSLYIDDVLYTVSQKKIKAHDLDDLQEQKTIVLPYKENVYNPPIYY